MALVATAFSVFLNSMISLPASEGIIPVSLQASQYQVAYGHSLVDFRVENGRVDKASICRAVSADIRNSCKQQAIALFADTCQQLQSQDRLQSNVGPSKTFCEAALTTPEQRVSIGLISQEPPDAAFLARQQCSELTLRAQSTGSGVHVQMRDNVCRKAKALSRPMNTARQQLASR